MCNKQPLMKQVHKGWSRRCCSSSVQQPALIVTGGLCAFLTHRKPIASAVRLSPVLILGLAGWGILQDGVQLGCHCLGTEQGVWSLHRVGVWGCDTHSSTVGAGHGDTTPCTFLPWDMTATFLFPGQGDIALLRMWEAVNQAK